MLYLIGTILFSQRTGFSAALLLGFSETYFFNSVNVASDTHSLFFILSGIYFFIKLREHYSSKWIILSGLFFSVAVITRYQSAAFILLPFFYVIWEKNKRELPNFLKQSQNIITPMVIFFAAMIPFAIIQFYINYVGYGSILPVQYAAATSSGFDTESFKFILNPIRIVYRLFFSYDLYSPIGIPLLIAGFFQIRNRPKTAAWYSSNDILFSRSTVFFHRFGSAVTFNCSRRRRNYQKCRKITVCIKIRFA